MRHFWRKKKLTLDRLLKKVAANDSQLRKVKLDGKDIGDEGAKRLAEALRDNTVVTYLDLRMNNIGVEGATALADLLTHNSSITELWLEDNSIGDEGAGALAEALKHNFSIAELSLWANGISDEGAMALARSLHQNPSITTLELGGNIIGDAGKRELVEMLQVNSSIIDLSLLSNSVRCQHQQRVYELIKINDEAPNPEDARRLKILCKVGWLLESKVDAETTAAVDLTLDQLGSFPQADERWGLFEKLLGSTERGPDVAASVDVATSWTLYRYAADCGAALDVLMKLLRAHPSLCACRDLRHGLFPFMLLATMAEAGVGDVLELLLLNPNLVEGGIGEPVVQLD